MHNVQTVWHMNCDQRIFIIGEVMSWISLKIAQCKAGVIVYRQLWPPAGWWGYCNARPVNLVLPSLTVTIFAPKLAVKSSRQTRWIHSTNDKFSDRNDTNRLENIGSSHSGANTEIRLKKGKTKQMRIILRALRKVSNQIEWAK